MPTQGDWTDLEVNSVTNAAMLVELADRGVPGFEDVRTIAPEWRKATTDFAAAVDDTPAAALRRQRQTLKRVSAKVNRRRIKWDAVTALLETRKAESA